MSELARRCVHENQGRCSSSSELGCSWRARPVVAHHAFAAEFDADKPVKLTGAVTKLDWTNPHAWIYVDVKDETGKVANWGFELASPNGLMRNGWTRFSLKPGDVVTDRR